MQRVAIELFYFGNKCYSEIAVELKTDEKRVKSLLQNGKRNLKICLEGRDVRY
jgi:RNA polymerase sigma-70 factor (ECF subfamily)